MAGRAPAPPEAPRSSRGHAYYAEQARRALGLSAEPRLADVPFPIVHAALGVAACAIAVALRPGAVGLTASVVGVTILCAATGVVIAVYDRLVYPPEHRPAVEAVALPVAALGAFSLVLAGTVDLRTRLVAAAITVVTCGGLPHLGGLRASGREGWAGRFLRDAAAIAVLVPVLLAAGSPALPVGLRVAVALAGTLLVSLDDLQSEALRRRQSLVLAGAISPVVTGALLAVDRAGIAPGVVAAVALVVWYGAKGVAGSAVFPPRRLAGALEHLAVATFALACLYWVTR